VLVNHFIGTARWWAATIPGDGDVAHADYTAEDFVAVYEESVQLAVAAFGANSALDPVGQLAAFLGRVV
jgi:hypothetical protein